MRAMFAPVQYPQERTLDEHHPRFGYAVYDKYNDPRFHFSCVLRPRPDHRAIAMLNGRMSKSPSGSARIGGLSEADAKRVSASALDDAPFEMLFSCAGDHVCASRGALPEFRSNLKWLWWDMWSSSEGTRHGSRSVMGVEDSSGHVAVYYRTTSWVS